MQVVCVYTVAMGKYNTEMHSDSHEGTHKT